MEQLDQPFRLCVLLMYGGGLRLLECLTLRVKDVDVERREIVVRGGKGGKDRRVPLAVSAIGMLRPRFAELRRRWCRDLTAGVRSTALTPALERKYPNASRDWLWSYVFPATRTFVDREAVRRRQHLHETVLHRAIVRAAREAGLDKRRGGSPVSTLSDAGLGLSVRVCRFRSAGPAPSARLHPPLTSSTPRHRVRESSAHFDRAVTINCKQRTFHECAPRRSAHPTPCPD